MGEMKYIIVKPARFVYGVFIITCRMILLLMLCVGSLIWEFDISWAKEEIELDKKYFLSADDCDYSVLQTGYPYLCYKTFWDYVNGRVTKYRA